MLLTTSFNIIHIFFKWPHRIPCDFSHVQFHSREKGERKKERKKARFPTLPSPSPSLFVKPKKKKERKRKKKPGETEQMLINRFLKITVNQS